MECGQRVNCSSLLCKEFGVLSFRFDFLPASQRASNEDKSAFKEKIWNILSDFPCIFMGDVSLTINIYCLEEERYEKDSSSDLDNLLKPLLDAMSGPKGIMVDDCQVQSLLVTWIDTYGSPYTEVVATDIGENVFLQKNNIFFIQFYNALCFPFYITLPKNLITCTISKLQRIYKIKEKYQNYTFEERLSKLREDEMYLALKGTLPSNRVFHKSRVLNFQLLGSEEFLAGKRI